MQAIEKGETKPPRRRWRRPSRRPSPEEERLGATIAEVATELESRSTSNAPWVTSARAHLDRARAGVNERRYGSAWLSIKAARRDLIDSFDWREVVIQSERLRIEAKEKLTSWRGPAIEALLDPAWTTAATEAHLRDAVATAIGPPSSKPDGSQYQDLRLRIEKVLSDTPPRNPPGDLTDGRRRLKEARRVFDEHEDNMWVKIEMLRRQVMGAGLVLFVLLVATFGALWIPAVADLDLSTLSDPVMILVVMLLGGLGAAVSGVLLPVGDDRTRKIPDLRAQYHVTWVRPLIGAAAALIVVTILSSGIGGVAIDTSAVPVAALAAGFSERFLGQSVAMASAALGR